MAAASPTDSQVANNTYSQIEMTEEESQPLASTATATTTTTTTTSTATRTNMIEPFETDVQGNIFDYEENSINNLKESRSNPDQGYLYNEGNNGQLQSPSNYYSPSNSGSISNINKVPYHDPLSPHYTPYSKILPYPIIYRLFPPNVPRSVQLLRKENLAIPMCYLVVGLLQGLSGPFINVYPLFLGATEAQQTTISSIRSLPALFKLFFGFWSDNVLFFGYRRKSYMLLGWVLSSMSMLCLLNFSDLSRVLIAQDDDDMNNNNNNGDDEVNMMMMYEPAENKPSVQFLSCMLLMFGTGFWFADVMGDSLVAEKAKLEPEETRGQLQSTCYACRFFGLMISAPISTGLYSTYGPQFVVKLLAIVPLVMVPFIFNLWERKDIEVKSTKDQCGEIWNTVCSRAVWQPMAFVYIYNVLQVGNAAWKEFLRSVLLFTDAQLNIMLIAAYVLLYVGVMTYKYYLIHWSWRSIYVMTTGLNAFLSALQVLLIQGITFGLSPFVFALGDDIFADFLAGIQFLVSASLFCLS